MNKDNFHNQQNPLADLLEEDFDASGKADELLRELLLGFVTLNAKNATFYLREEALVLPKRVLVLLPLLAQLALKRLQLTSDASLAPKEIAKLLAQENVPLGTVKSCLQFWRTKRVFSPTAPLGRLEIEVNRLGVANKEIKAMRQEGEHGSK